MTFNPNEHVMQLKSKDGMKDYLPVQWRLVWFREQCPLGVIETEMVLFDPDRVMEDEVFVWNAEKRRSEKVTKSAKGLAIFRTIAKDGKGGIATGTKMEKAVSFPDYVEKAETGSVGRALAALGYGTQFAPELDEEDRIVDAPVDRANGTHAQESRQPSIAEQVIALRDGLKPLLEKSNAPKELPKDWWSQYLIRKFKSVPADFTQEHINALMTARFNLEQKYGTPPEQPQEAQAAS